MHLTDLFPNTFTAVRQQLARDTQPKRVLIKDMLAYDSELCRELQTTYAFTEEQVRLAVDRYLLGKSRSGKTIYWLIDEQGTVCDGCLNDTWVSTLLRRRQPALAAYIVPRHCLFGQHLLTPQAKVALVASPRAAVILSLVYPSLTWLAYVYPANLTVDRFEPLSGHSIILFPRADSQSEFYLAALELAQQVSRLYALSLTVSTILEDHATPEQKARQIGLVDYLFSSP